MNNNIFTPNLINALVIHNKGFQTFSMWHESFKGS